MRKITVMFIYAILICIVVLSGCGGGGGGSNDNNNGGNNNHGIGEIGSDTGGGTYPSGAIIINHNCTRLSSIPATWISQAKANLIIAYGHTSHGSQITDGMTGLVEALGSTYSWNNDGSNGALQLRDFYGNFGNLGTADDLGAPDRTAWNTATRSYLTSHNNVNVIIWSWCGQASTDNPADIQTYLDLMNQLEIDYPHVKFVYMTGHTNGGGLNGSLHLRNNQIRQYCIEHGKILFDFEDIESYNPDGTYFGDKYVNDGCYYDTNNDHSPEGNDASNWAIRWQDANPGKWYNCGSAHSQPINANMKAYAAWWLWARLAGWNGQVAN